MKVSYLLSLIFIAIGSYFFPLINIPDEHMILGKSLINIMDSNKLKIDSLNNFKSKEIEKYTIKIKNNMEIIQNEEEYISKINMSTDSIVDQIVCSPIE